MSVEENKALVQRLVEVYNTGNLAALGEVLAPEFVYHNAPPGQKPGREGYKEAQMSGQNAFPDLHYTIEDMIAEGDKVVVRVTCSGTHRGEFMGIAPTNKRVTMPAVGIYRIVNGKIFEEWEFGDMLGFMQELGAVTIKTASK